MDKGQPLAARCSEFDYAVQNVTQRASVPTIPVIRLRFVFLVKSVPHGQDFQNVKIASGPCRSKVGLCYIVNKSLSIG